MYINRMKCSNCGKGEIVSPDPNQSINDYLNTKRCSNCGKTGNWSKKVLSFKQINFSFRMNIEIVNIILYI